MQIYDDNTLKPRSRRSRSLVPILLLLLIVFIGAWRREAKDADTTLVSPPWTHCFGLHKVTQFHLDIYSGYKEKFNDPQGLFCIKLDCEDRPDDPRDDDELTVYGVNSGNNDIIYNTSLTSIDIVGGFGNGPMLFDRPLALAGNSAGDLYVADSGNNRIAHLRYENDKLRWVGDIRGNDQDPLDGPSGVALSGGLIYVADTGKDRISVFTPEGAFVKSFSPQSRGFRLRKPFSIAVVSPGDDYLYYAEYFIVVTDSLGQRLWKISLDGQPIGILERSSLGSQGSFGHVTIDYYGNIYVTDAVSGTIHKFSRYLGFLASVGRKGAGEPSFDEPRGICCYRRFGQIFVSERSGAQYFWIGTDVQRFEADSLIFYLDRRRCSIDVSFFLTEYATISLVLRDTSGKDRFTLLPEYLLPPGRFARRIEVDCPDAEALAKCKLSLSLAAKPTYSSRRYLTVKRVSRILSPHIVKGRGPLGEIP